MYLTNRFGRPLYLRKIKTVLVCVAKNLARLVQFGPMRPTIHSLRPTQDKGKGKLIRFATLETRSIRIMTLFQESWEDWDVDDQHMKKQVGSEKQILQVRGTSHIPS